MDHLNSDQNQDQVSSPQILYNNFNWEKFLDLPLEKESNDFNNNNKDINSKEECQNQSKETPQKQLIGQEQQKKQRQISYGKKKIRKERIGRKERQQIKKQQQSQGQSDEQCHNDLKQIKDESLIKFGEMHQSHIEQEPDLAEDNKEQYPSQDTHNGKDSQFSTVRNDCQQNSHKPNQNQQINEQVKRKQKPKDKKIIILSRIQNYKEGPLSFKLETDFKEIFYGPIIQEQLYDIKTIKRYSEFKRQLKLEQIKGVKQKKYDGENGKIQITLIMLIRKTKGIMGEIFIIDLSIAFNLVIISDAIEQLYFLYRNQPMTKEINWKEVSKILKDYLLIGRNFFKSHCCAYYKYFKDQYEKLFANDWIKLRYENEDWQKNNGEGNCIAGKKTFKKQLQGNQGQKIIDFTINQYLTYHLRNKECAEPSLIYVDDLFNLIAQADEF